MIRGALVAALVLVATLEQCGNPPSIRGNDGTPCPRPQPAVYFAGEGEVLDRHYSAHPGCEPQWFIKIREDSNGREVWMKVADVVYSWLQGGPTVAAQVPPTVRMHMTETHEWTEETPARTPWRSDYVCENCGATKTVVRIEMSRIVALAVLLVALVVMHP